MINYLRAWCALSTMCLGAACAADTITILPSKDNTLYQDDLGLLSNGQGAYLFAGVNGLGEIRRAVIAFDLSAIPPGSTVKSVTLRLNMSRTQDAAEPVSLHRALQDWGEGTSNAAANEGRGAPAATGDATWIHTFFDTSEWTDGASPAPGGHFVLAPSATTAVDQVGPYSWSDPLMVSDVQTWVDVGSVNFGWVIRGFEDGASTAKRFDSRENSVVANRPQLTVTFTPPIAACPCDFDHDGAVSSPDFFGFLVAFFNMALEADFDGSGQVNSADFFAFLTCFFEPPASCQ
ncbi:MAG: DNRLRE domain-containing protein [Phycisphaerales bacterium]